MKKKKFVLTEVNKSENGYEVKAKQLGSGFELPFDMLKDGVEVPKTGDELEVEFIGVAEIHIVHGDDHITYGGGMVHSLTLNGVVIFGTTENDDDEECNCDGCNGGNVDLSVLPKLFQHRIGLLEFIGASKRGLCAEKLLLKAVAEFIVAVEVRNFNSMAKIVQEFPVPSLVTGFAEAVISEFTDINNPTNYLKQK